MSEAIKNPFLSHYESETKPKDAYKKVVERIAKSL